MANQDFQRYIAELQDHLAALAQRLSQAPLAEKDIAAAALNELSTSIEELRVAQEEMRQQGDELAGASVGLERERQRYLDLFEFAPDGYLVTDPDGVIRQANRASAALLNVRQDFLAGKPISTFVADDNMRAFRSQMLALALQRRFRNWALHMVPRDGAPFPASVNISAIHHSETGEDYLLWLVRDVTEPKRAEQALVQAQADLEDRAAHLEAALEELQALSRAVAQNAHAPLRIIENLLLEVEKSLGNMAGKSRSHMAQIRTATRRVDELMQNLLRLFHVALTPMKRETVDLTALVRQIAGDLGSAETARLVEFDIADGVVVEGDRELLRLALTNLLQNAWKFTSSKGLGKIAFGVKWQDRKPWYFVSDNGVGFNMAQSVRLFIAFERLHSGNDFPGLGMGLAIVERVVRRHGGHVKAESSPNQGATFFFSLD